jgi:hypothetical protein
MEKKEIWLPTKDKTLKELEAKVEELKADRDVAEGLTWKELNFDINCIEEIIKIRYGRTDAEFLEALDKAIIESKNPIFTAKELIGIGIALLIAGGCIAFLTHVLG